MFKRIFKIFGIVLLSLFGLVVLVLILVNLTAVQNLIAQKAAQILSDKLKTKVAIKHVRIDFLNHARLEGLYIEDRQGDTLLYAGETSLRITDWFFIKKEIPVIRYIGLHKAYAHLYRTRASDEWNFQFVVDAFDTGKRDSTKKQNEFELDLEKVDIRQVRFKMEDAWAGSDMNIGIGNLQLDAKEIDLKKKVIDINSLDINYVVFGMRQYVGGKPKKAKTDSALKVIDTTAFNPDKWMVRANKLDLQNGKFFGETSDTEPTPNAFDPEHIRVTDITLKLRDVNIAGDTLRTSLKMLSAKERSGLVVKKMTAKVFVSPNASIADNLLLETNRSTLKRYYAMHYKRFPDFTDYIHKVKMSGDFKDAHVDSRDVAFFAPPLLEYPTILEMNGLVYGTVDSLYGKNLNITDGQSRVKGNLLVRGLPEIDNTLFNLKNGAVFTSGEAILKYAPRLRNNPNVDLAQLRYILYQGDFTGYITNFAASGMVATNLGNITSDITLKVIGKGTAYSGDIATSGFALGTLIRQPLLGSLAFNTTVKGTTTDPKNPFISMDGTIPFIDFNKYRYTNISVNGLLEGKNFVGRAIVDDPNLAFAFYGGINFLENQLAINATANLLSSNLQALNITKDSVNLAADFNLDFTGNTIDDFLGYARLYNINLLRNGHHLDIDSVYLTSALEGTEKLITIESNNITADVRGKFELSTLPYSFQYYIAGYLPNYIATPEKYAPDQVLNFNLRTREMDSLFAVLAPAFRGFNNTTVSGSLNTNTQQLTLDAYVPNGYFNNIYFNKVSVKGTGDFRSLKLNANANKIDVGNGVLSASVDVNTTLGNDSLIFSIDSKSPEAYGTASLNGSAFARGDTLYMNVRPSELFLNGVRWEIPEGNSFVFSDNYLQVRNFNIKSGEQQLAFSSLDESTTSSLLLNATALNIAQIGNVAGISKLQPSGILNGTVRLDSLFGDVKINTDLTATNVMFGADTIGTVIADAGYNVRKQLLTLHPRSGIFFGNASLRPAGFVSFDTGSRQQLNGYVQFNDASATWLAPLTQGLISELSGTINGTMNFGGSPTRPDVNGNVSLTNSGFTIDILGTHYTIPAAVIKMDNNSIDFNNLRLFDRFNNEAILNGSIAHNRLQNFHFNRVQLHAPEFEVIHLRESESSIFYGDLIANVEALSITGTFDDIHLNVTASPAARSHIYIPIQSSTDIGTYSYVTFTNYDTIPQVGKQKARSNKFSLNIVAKINPLAEITMVLDPTTGDAINATGSGNITLSLPANEPMKMFGNYDIEQGDYTFTFKELFFRRNFIITSGSRISFYGPIESTSMDVDAIYTTRARLYDALSEYQKQAIENTPEAAEAKQPQDVSVGLNMTGSLSAPKFSYNIFLPQNRTEGSITSQTLKQINQNESEIFNQVAALLLINNFIPQSGFGGTATGALVNNVSDILSSTASSQLTNLASRLLGDPNLSIDLKYKNYNLSDPNAGGINRNQVSFGIRKNLLNDRLVVELGSAYDWGRPSSTNRSTSNLNLGGDFRVQYLLTDDGRIRLNAFRTSNYDVLVDRSIYRGGVGISFRKSFNTIGELLGIQKAKPTTVQTADSAAKTQGTQ